jgi:hypothetical protein
MILLAGAVIPFFWIPLVIWLFLRMRRNRSAEKASDAATETETAGTGKPT